jgi:transcriptional regulator with XRE-family HTH domain
LYTSLIFDIKNNVLNFELMEELHEKIKRLRKAQGISQLQLAKLIGISQPTLTNIEKGITDSITISVGKKLADELDVDFYELFDIPFLNIEKDNMMSKIHELEKVNDDLEKKINEKDSFIASLTSSGGNAFGFVLQEFINNYNFIFNIFSNLLKESYNTALSEKILSERNRFISFEKKLLQRYNDMGIFTIEELKDEIAYRNDIGAKFLNINEM